MSSDVSFCIYCNEPIPKGQICCRKCYEEDKAQAYAFGKKYNTNP